MIEKRKEKSVHSKTREVYRIMKSKVIRNLLKEKTVNIKREPYDQEDEGSVSHGLMTERTFSKNSFSETVTAKPMRSKLRSG